MNHEHYITTPEDCKPCFGQALCVIDPAQKITVVVNSRERPLVENVRCDSLSIHGYEYLTGCTVSGVMVRDGVLIIGIMVGGGPR